MYVQVGGVVHILTVVADTGKWSLYHYYPLDSQLHMPAQLVGMWCEEKNPISFQK